MIRFLPDSWVDVVMRPLDMAAPEANSYVEIAAPDLRFAAAIVLAVVVLLLWRRRARAGGRAMALLVLLLASSAIWLATTGNGRYFIAWLVLLGPLCVGLIAMLPLTAGRKLALALGLLGAQAVVVAENEPWGAWAWLDWNDPPYFKIDPPPREPATYVTIANISYSLLAPQFPAQSRWVGLGGGVGKRDQPALEKILSESPRLVLIAPALPSATTDKGEPNPAAADALGKLLQPHKLSLKSANQCRLLPSEGLLRIAHRRKEPLPAEIAKRYGFWLCPVEYRPGPDAAPPEVPSPVVADFTAVERLCPRFFSGGDTPMQVNGGWLKHYDSDTKVYLMDDGIAWYKFWRSLNAVRIGTREELRAGRAVVDCANIRAPNWRRGGP